MKELNNTLIKGFIPDLGEGHIVLFVENQIFEVIKDTEPTTNSGEIIVVKNEDDFNQQEEDWKTFSMRGIENLRVNFNEDLIPEENKSLVRLYGIGK